MQQYRRKLETETVSLTSEDTKAFSTSFKPYITADNAQAICEGLRGRMENFSLRLCITMQQSVCSGMTSYWLIWDAISAYPGFGWADVAVLIPQDFTKYSEAVVVVGNNPYYGFNQDLREAKHTNYMSLSWVACKLLLKCDPPNYSSLTRYRGIPAHPKREEELTALINGYNLVINDEARALGRAAFDTIRARIAQALDEAQRQQ